MLCSLEIQNDLQCPEKNKATQSQVKNNYPRALAWATTTNLVFWLKVYFYTTVN